MGSEMCIRDSSLLDLSPSRSHAPLSVCACHCYSAGDIKVLEKCTQLTSVNFFRCQQVTGESSGGSFLSELRTSPLFLRNFQSTFLVLFHFLYLSHRRTIYSNSLDGALRTAHALLDLSPSPSHGPLSVCACHCYSAGDIKALEKCTQLTSVNFFCLLYTSDAADE